MIMEIEDRFCKVGTAFLEVLSKHRSKFYSAI